MISNLRRVVSNVEQYVRVRQRCTPNTLDLAKTAAYACKNT